MKLIKKILFSRYFILLLFLVGLFLVFKYTPLREYFQPMKAREAILAFGIWAPLIFIFFYILITVFFIPGSPFSILAGTIFGPIFGTLYIVLGAGIGSAITFLFTRFFGRDLIEKKFANYLKKIKEQELSLKKNGFLAVLLLRLLPIIPYNVLNYILGLTKIRFKDYFLGTVIGIIPGSFIYAFFGDSLANLNFISLIVSVFLFVLLSTISYLVLKFKKLNKNQFDIIILGAGSAGLNIAGFMNKAGFKVLLINKDEKTIGGDCLNYGCVPSKALIYHSKIVNQAKKASKYGLEFAGDLDFEKIKQEIKATKAKIREHENADYFRSLGMTVKLGKPVFVAKNKLKLKDKIYQAKKIVIATGSRPRKLKLPGIEKVKVYDNESIFEIEKFPKKLLVLGGGPIGIEIAQAFERLGSEVCIIQREEMILPKEDQMIAKKLLEILKKEGIKFYLNSEIKEFISEDQAIIKIFKGEEKLEFDALFIAIGRELNTQGLNLEKAKIKFDQTGKIKVDNYLRTTNKNVYLSGDIAGSYQFTHATELHASIIIKNFFALIKKKLNYDKFAWVTYTDPEVATFGLNEGELKKRGIKYQVLETSFKDDDRAIIEGNENGYLKLFIAKNKILGGTMLAKNAGELSSELILSMNNNLKLNQIFSRVYPYPVASRINKTIIAKHLGKSLGRKGVRRVLRGLYH
jgi:pyruvate/2-oxoglutarate dehydrogenase complex dihydrolipoamide dehydrogenase (E3) component/membrane protein YqaA with SNARE-associated domain